MSYNPVRAANFRKTGRKRQPLNPHAGTKHSDIMKRQGLGTTVPMSERAPTRHGFAAEVFASDDFTVRSEVIGAGNTTGFGVHLAGDRVYHVVRGVLYVFVEGKSANGTPQRDVLQVQQGAFFKAPRGLKYGVASSGTSDVEVLVVESADYAAGYEELEPGEARDVEGTLTGNTPPAPKLIGAESPRRKDQSKAKAQAEAMAAKTRRRKPRGPVAASGAGVPIGANAATNPNSGNVEGVNPMPVMPTGE